MTSLRLTTRSFGTAGLVVAAALLSGCGSSSKTLSAPTTTAASSAPTTGASTGASAAAPLVSSSVDAQASVAASATAGGGTDTNSKFCQLAKAEQAQSTQLGSQLTSSDPTQLKTFIQQAVGALPAFEAAAPDSIKSSVQALVSADNQLFATLKADNYDFTKAGPSIEKLVSNPAFAADEQKVASYLMTTCGIADPAASATATP